MRRSILLDSVINLLRTVALFILALALGGMLAGLIASTGLVVGKLKMPDLSELRAIIFGAGLTFAVFGGLPALVVGMPAVLLLRRMRVSRFEAPLILMTGGGVVGAGLMAMTFTGFELLGAAVGGSIGLMLGILVYPTKERASNDVSP